MSALISSIILSFSFALASQADNISGEMSMPVTVAVWLCAIKHNDTPPEPMPTSKTCLALVGANAANHTASDVGLYIPRCIFTRPPTRVKISCFVLICLYNNASKIKGKKMLEEVLVVQSAVSAFNNAALWAPAFLWWAILAMPLFFIAYSFGTTVMQSFGWGRENILSKVSLWTAGLTLSWVVLFGGNYNVLRNEISVLPFMVALIVFLTSLFVASHTRKRPLPHGWRAIVLGVLVLCAVGLSDTHAWWGPLLQIGALLLGGLLGRFARSEMRPIGGTVLISLVSVIAILMQPEFFRFGQLGNLTIFHLLAVLSFGIVGVSVVVLFNVSPAHKIKFASAIKLKWLLRVVCLLLAALFVLTESVPMFIGTMISVFFLLAISVRYAKVIDVTLGHKLFGVLLMLFGLITVMPVITVLGIVYWKMFPGISVGRQFLRLL